MRMLVRNLPCVVCVMIVLDVFQLWLHRTCNIDVVLLIVHVSMAVCLTVPIQL